MPLEPTPAAAGKSPGEHGGPPATDDTAAARQSAHDHDDRAVDEAGDESFPASDPPSYTPTHAGTPDDQR